jgi:hypothetical protein
MIQDAFHVKGDAFLVFVNEAHAKFEFNNFVKNLHPLNGDGRTFRFVGLHSFLRGEQWRGMRLVNVFYDHAALDYILESRRLYERYLRQVEALDVREVAE